MNAFQQRIDVAPENVGLQRALANATLRFSEKHLGAAGALANWEELRSQANAIKRHTIENLGHYLEQLEARVAGRG